VEEIGEPDREFEPEHACASVGDRAWASSVATALRAMVATQRRELQIEHPDMPAVSEPTSEVRVRRTGCNASLRWRRYCLTSLME
jgi:hypothetical protein